MVLRLYSSSFALIAGLFMSGVSLVLLLSGSQNFKFDMLPYWKGNGALYGLLGLGLLGILAGALGFLNKMRPLLIIFTLILMCGVVYGFFISPVYRFGGAAEAKAAAWLALGALVAFLGSLAPQRRTSRA